jgi:hypothetical protein
LDPSPPKLKRRVLAMHLCSAEGSAPRRSRRKRKRAFSVEGSDLRELDRPRLIMKRDPRIKAAMERLNLRKINKRRE